MRRILLALGLAVIAAGAAAQTPAPSNAQQQQDRQVGEFFGRNAVLHDLIDFVLKLSQHFLTLEVWLVNKESRVFSASPSAAQNAMTT